MKDMALEYYLKEIRNFPLLNRENERKLVLQYQQNDDRKAREQLITSNLRLVVSVAKRYGNCGIGLADLIAEGNMGLIYAIEKFKPTKGCRLSTYATCWIKHAICKAINEKRSLVRIPLYMNKLLFHCKEKSSEILRRSGKAPTNQELIQDAMIAVSQNKIVNEALNTSKALDRIVSLQNLEINQEYIEDRRVRDEFQKVIEQSEIDHAICLLRSMEYKRYEIIRMRYGLDGCNRMTLKQVAESMNLTKERIRQIEKETLQILKECLEKKSNFMEKAV